eukprot:14989819-Ditylum_brightwellii.AAC.1
MFRPFFLAIVSGPIVQHVQDNSSRTFQRETWHGIWHQYDPATIGPDYQGLLLAEEGQTVMT